MADPSGSVVSRVPAVLHRDARLPEERRRLRQAGRRAARGRHGSDRRRRARRPRRGEHLRVHRRGPPRVDRHDPGARRAAPRRLAAGGHRLHGRALRRRAGGRTPRGRSGRRLRPGVQRDARGARRHRGAERTAAQADPGVVDAAAGVRSAEPAAAEVGGSVGLREDRRGLRPLVRVLRDPELPGPAAQPRRRVDPRRGRTARSARDRARRAGSRLVRQGPPRRARRRLDRAAGERRRRRRRPGAAAVPVPERPDRRLDRRDLRLGRAVLRPVAAARQQAAAAPDAALG